VTRAGPGLVDLIDGVLNALEGSAHGHWPAAGEEAMTAITRPRSRKLSWPEPRKRVRYLPQGLRDVFELEITVDTTPPKTTKREAFHQDADLALAEAQVIALDHAGDELVEVTVVRRPIGFGRAATLYQVVRDEDGSVTTHRINLED
jgi:hypothetical protein